MTSRREAKTVLLYERIKSDLRQRIVQGEVKPDENIGSERELTIRHGVSRITIRKALQDLEKEGLVYRVSGKGTFARLAKGKIVHRLLTALSVYDFYADAFCAEIFAGIQEESHRLGLHLITGKVSDDSHSQDMIDHVTREHPADGYLLVSEIPADLIAFMKKRKCPTIMVDNYLKDESLPGIMSDNIAGAYSATKYLMNLGHRKIAHLTYRVLLAPSFSQRQTGWQNALSEGNLRNSSELAWNWNYHQDPQGEQIKKKMLSERPTAIFCANDDLAINFMRILEELKIDVPTDISVVGFDDTPFARFVSLTTIAVPKKDMGIIAVKRLVNVIQGTDFGPATTILPVKLIARKSTAKPKNV